jgi:hypothetical protein
MVKAEPLPGSSRSRLPLPHPKIAVSDRPESVPPSLRTRSHDRLTICAFKSGAASPGGLERAAFPLVFAYQDRKTCDPATDEIELERPPPLDVEQERPPPLDVEQVTSRSVEAEDNCERRGSGPVQSVVHVWLRNPVMLKSFGRNSTCSRISKGPSDGGRQPGPWHRGHARRNARRAGHRSRRSVRRFTSALGG